MTRRYLEQVVDFLVVDLQEGAVDVELGLGGGEGDLLEEFGDCAGDEAGVVGVVGQGGEEGVLLLGFL